MESKELGYKSFYDTPDNISVCNFCTSQAKDQKREESSHTSFKNNYSKLNLTLDFDYTPGRFPYFNTPGYPRHLSFYGNNSEGNFNNAK